MPRVSVIVPAYNAAAHLAGALESVVAQSYSDWEVIVADDGSVDATAQIACTFGDHVRLVRSPVNRGLAATRNLALDHARGELVALLDSDDRWEPDYLQELVALYDREQARDSNVGIVCCDAWLADASGRTNERYAHRFGRPADPMDAAVLLRSNPIFVSALCPRRVIEEAGRFDARLRSVEDLDLWLRIVELGYRVAYHPQPLAVYRISPGSLSRDVLRMTRSRQAVYRAALRRGRLDSAARREAQRAIALERAAELVEMTRRNASIHPMRAALGAAVSAPFVARVLLARNLRRLRSTVSRAAHGVGRR